MIRNTALFCVVLLMVAGMGLAIHASQDKGIEGAWKGVLEVQGTQLRLVLNISKKPDGSLTATLDSPDQGAKDIPVDVITFENNTLKFEIKSLQASYEGKLNENFEIEGTFTQVGMSFPLVLKQKDKAPDVK